MNRHHIRRWLGTSIFILAAAAGICRAATPEQIQKAIDKAQRYLITHRSTDGTWEIAPHPELSTAADWKNRLQDYRGRQWGGLTALTTYALLASGMDQRADELKEPIHFLLTANLQGTYALGLSSQLVLFLPEKLTREMAKRNLALLYAGMIAPPERMLRSPQLWPDFYGFYSYFTGFPQGTDERDAAKAMVLRNPGTAQPFEILPNGTRVIWYDRSNGQYAVLGMWALAENGGEIRNLYWQIEDLAWKHAQFKDGGWNYNPDPKLWGAQESPAMTAAGIATLFITQDYTAEENWGSCRGGIRNEFIERGLNWMDQHIDQAFNSLYGMYGIERIGTASGRRYFGTKDWFQMGADYLIGHQQPDGSWNDKTSCGPIANTGFGLLFLARGRAPVMINKLQYESVDRNIIEPWNERPRDIANLARWAGKQDEAYYNWQVVNLRVTPEELHDAPILYISGSQPLNFTPDEEAKLRTYVQEGGMILGNSDCGKETFTRSFQELGKKLFKDYSWRQASPTDFIYTEQFKEFRPRPKVMELSNGIRKLMMLIPDSDASKAWQIRSTQNGGQFGLGTNIFLYATDKKNLFTKGDTYWMTPNPAVPAAATLKVARLDVGSNPNPEPGGWVRMNAIMHNRFKTDLSVELIKPTALSSGGYQVADLTGTGKFTLSPADRAAIKQFVSGGGTLIVDAAGGDVLFADAAENELHTIFGAKTEPLDPIHPVYSVSGTKLEKIGWRKFVGDRIADKSHAQLRGIAVDGRTAVFFSREDLCEGIVGEPVDGVLGYDPATATELMAAMLSFAQYGGHPPALAPVPVATTPGATPSPAVPPGAH